MRDIDGITQRLNTRWLVSILDTFVDYSKVPGEREAAMLIVVFVNNEKLFRSLLLAHEQVREMIPNQRVDLGDGVTSFVSGANADMFVNMMKRIKKTLKAHPALYRIFRTIILRMAANQESTICRLDQSCNSKPLQVVKRVWR